MVVYQEGVSDREGRKEGRPERMPGAEREIPRARTTNEPCAIYIK
jgi:hypothetical protein